MDRFLYVGEATRRLFQSYGAPDCSLVRAPHAVDNARLSSRPTRSDPGELAASSLGDPRRCLLRPLRRQAGVTEAPRRRDRRPAPAENLGPRADLPRALRGRRGPGDALEGSAGSCSTRRARADGSRGFRFAVCQLRGLPEPVRDRKAYVAADVLVLPSESETWGLVVNEALACGLPCVVSDACGSAEDLVIPLDPRLCYPVGDVEALARAIRHAAEHPPSARPCPRSSGSSTSPRTWRRSSGSGRGHRGPSISLIPAIMPIGPVRRPARSKPGAKFPRLGGRREGLERQHVEGNGLLVLRRRNHASRISPASCDVVVPSSKVTQTAPPTARINSTTGLRSWKMASTGLPDSR